ncbi:ABC transporter permease [Lysinibacillus sphaericus]|uniref:Metal ion ABC transporter permease n=1 Tax=Lysinibacillus sphaericus TaxID=1421 RepID=A0A2S0K587_LYSSH|nr:methionine ABC transporter permease [Lysinibacillus sphaericus]AVK98533.1 methionine ABC transporter permease [Lysinibacillus sphaericus]MED4544059.1 ABC transporter permease [Lysinibacillus sphaericus]TKI17387.1 ABC transporter permease [Lysinibacillus sphaericus]SUV15496.1 metal ion ABC transporter permease [Lysinibacillus sphaericus]GEC83144.1 ABC transporter permease [Lysinibacillus sphaericus]
MFDVTHLIDMVPDLLKAFQETIIMIGISLSVSIVLGLPLGILLFVTDKGLFWENRLIKSVFGFAVNLIRSIPYIILLVALFPLTKLLVGQTIGPIAASVSLSVAAIPFFARLVETSLREIDKGVIEASIAVGATPWMIIKDVLIPEAKSSIIQAVTVTVISLVAFSAMAGVVGGGGIGDLAIRFGYYRYDNTIMIATVAILILLVQAIQIAGDWFAKSIDKR